MAFDFTDEALDQDPSDNEPVNECLKHYEDLQTGNFWKKKGYLDSRDHEERKISVDAIKNLFGLEDHFRMDIVLDNPKCILLFGGFPDNFKFKKEEYAELPILLFGVKETEDKKSVVYNFEGVYCAQQNEEGRYDLKKVWNRYYLCDKSAF